MELKAIKTYIKDLNEDKSCDNITDFGEQILQELEFVVKENESKWIDVNKKLPEKGIDVLCRIIKLSWTDSEFAVGYLKLEPLRTDNVWKIDGRHITHYQEAVNNCVTHWMHIASF